MNREGVWWVRSKVDPRWNCEGRDLCGGFTMPKKCKEAVEELKTKLGDAPPDLEWSYIKD